MIGFNPKFILDALRVIDDEEITMYLVNPKAPLSSKTMNSLISTLFCQLVSTCNCSESSIIS